MICLPYIMSQVANTPSTSMMPNLSKAASRAVVFTELSKKHDGHIELSILGHVYDVTKGVQYYGKGAGCACDAGCRIMIPHDLTHTTHARYECFSGRDATLSFITGVSLKYC